MIPVNRPLLDGNEGKYLQECIETGWISSEGPFISRFEQAFAQIVGRKHAIAVANGTAAIDISVAALGIGPGDEVIVPSFTIISCVLQIVRAGAKPIFVDSDPQTWNMDVTQIEARLSPRTKAIMVVHIYGLPVDMDPILKLARKYRLKIIEDAAEAHGQTYNGQACGSFGDLSTFSFYPNKLITTGEGGIIMTDNLKLAERCRTLRNLAFQPTRRFVHRELGWNYRMTNLQAAVGLAQLERYSEFIEIKKKIGQRYNQLLVGTPGLQLPVPRTTYADNIYWVYGVVLKRGIKTNARVIMAQLAKLGVATRPFFYPMHQQPVLKKLGLTGRQLLPTAAYLGERGFYLPSGLGVTDDEVKASASALKAVLQPYNG
jgi:perosamine synthetase